MSPYRRSLAAFVGAVVAASASALAAPAQGASEPTTLAVEGKLQVVVVDGFGSGAHAEQLHTVVTDGGAEIPVELDDDAPANGRFHGEVVIAGGVASALRSMDLLPRAGTTIDEDTRAGRVAVAAAEGQTRPLTVASSTVAPVTAAAVTTPAPHRVFVAVLNNRGTIEETDAQISDRVEEITDYWVAESDGVITSFEIQGGVTRFNSDYAGDVSTNCGMGNPYAVWSEAGALFPDLSSAEGSGDHLIVAMADECGALPPIANGIAGVALVGTDFSSGGPMSFSMGDIATQVGVHEVGHTFGLGHANLQRCAGCGIESYEDLYSPMGLAISGGDFEPPALDSAFRMRLGVAGAAEVPLVTAANGPATRTIHLDPRDGASGPRGIHIVDPVSGSQYFVDHRSGAGRDAATFYSASWNGSVGTGIFYRPGVTVTTLGENTSLTLLPALQSIAAHSAGQTFVSPTGVTTIVVNALSGASGADVTVTFRIATPPPAALKKFSARTPKITGTAHVGKTLKVKVGSWSPRPSYRYQWYANGKKITKKGTKSSFKLTSRQKGKRLTVRVTGSKSGYTTIVKASKSTKKVARRR